MQTFSAVKQYLSSFVIMTWCMHWIWTSTYNCMCRSGWMILRGRVV